jgi:multiple sugar transport system substrate-binding protein
MNLRSTTAAVAVLAAATMMASCSSSGDSGGATPAANSVAPSTAGSSTTSTAPVSISVASLIPGSTADATKQFNAQIAEFEKAYPNITVKSVQYQWTGPTFAAKLAAGTLPTVFTVPFTDGRTLGQNGQLADLTTQAEALPYYSKFNPAVLAEAKTSDGKVIALPTAAYAQALHYNRKLFAQAGLDPNKPPTTWDELRADAKQIADKTGEAGYAEMAKNDNTGGWILTTLAYAFGGRMETGTGTSAQATLDNTATQQVLQLLHDMRWSDNSMGSDFSYGWSDINQAFAAGKIGMYVSGSDVYTNLVQASKIDPSMYGLTTIPLEGTSTAGVLGGGTLAAVRPDANDATKDAAVKWIDFYYEQPLVDKAQAIRNAQTLQAGKQPVGVPALPVFDKTQYDLANTWIKSYINVPQNQMTPFTDRIFDQTLVPEPAASTQSVYHSLDSVVQAVLTQKDANVDALLKTANGTAQNLIAQGK